MRSIISITTILLLLSSICLHSQSTITISFTGIYSGSHLPPDSIKIENISQGYDTVLYQNDSVLTLDQGVGIIETSLEENNELVLYPSYPNPFNTETTISFYNPREQKVAINIYDLSGRLLINKERKLPTGINYYNFYPSTGNFYILVISTKNDRKVQRLINTGNATNNCALKHQGFKPYMMNKRSLVSSFPWAVGDDLKFTGYSNHGGDIILQDVIYDNPLQSTDYTFQFKDIICGENLTFIYNGNVSNYGTVSRGCLCWMDRNLGALTVAASNNDSTAFGDLFQWGRSPDGHHLRISDTTSSLSISDTPGHDLFITSSYHPFDWRDPQNDNLWQGITCINNPCPTGWRLPSADELDKEKKSWLSNNTSGAHGSSLNWAAAGNRAEDGMLSSDMGQNGYVWSSTVDSVFSKALVFEPGNAFILKVPRAKGISVRCVADTSSIAIPVKARFFASDTIAFTGDTINFINTSAGFPENYIWHFGSGDSSILQNPGYAYDSAGTYSVTLIASNSFSQDTMIKTQYIRVCNKGTFCCGITDITFLYNNKPYTKGSISRGGYCWLDRNLGAERVPVSSNDSLGYGDLFQWGRRDDGHQVCNSLTTLNIGNNIVPGHDRFIISNDQPHDWINPQHDSLWDIATGINNPCPEGWRIPTELELNLERMSWDENNSTGAYNSSLKWAMNGYRNCSGAISNTGNIGAVWASTTVDSSSYYLSFDNNITSINSGYRAEGRGVRCIKDSLTSTIKSPRASFFVSDTIVHQYDTLYFTDLSIHNPTSWKWCFGDGDSSSQKNPVHIYYTPGVYTITLIVSNLEGSDTIVKTNYINVCSAGTFCCGDSITFQNNGVYVTYGTIPRVGLCWLDRNLGASRVPISSYDSLGYGDLFQWGRYDDGHQVKTSGTTQIRSNIDMPGHDLFIISTCCLVDWRFPQNHNLWQGQNGINNPCPEGWRLPTETELDLERSSWNKNDAEGAYSSTLKWPLSGRRNFDSTVSHEGTEGYVWSSTTIGATSAYMSFSTTTNIASYYRAMGMSVRCVIDDI